MVQAALVVLCVSHGAGASAQTLPILMVAINGATAAVAMHNLSNARAAGRR